MRRAFKFGVLLTLLILLSIGGGTIAQTEEPELVTIRYLLSTEMMIDADAAATDAQNLIDQAQINLANDGITLIVLDWNTRPNSNLSIRISGDGAGNGWVNVRTSTPYYLEVSSVLSAHYGTGVNFPLENSTLTTSMTTALSFYSINHCDLASDYFETALTRISTVEESYRPYLAAYIAFYQGTCALVEGDYEEAISIFENGLAHEGLERHSQPEIVTNLAWAYLQISDPHSAFDLMDRVIYATSTNHIFFLSRRAQLYALAFRYDDAIADMDAAIELEPENPELYVLRGNITLLIYEWDRVLADYNTAIELAPDYADAYFYRGVFYYTRTDYQLALDDLNHYLELAPDGEHVTDTLEYIQQINQTLEVLGGS
jgi:tetratricopeptide (TPR) repeat protein